MHSKDLASLERAGLIFLFEILPEWTGRSVFNGDSLVFQFGAKLVGSCPIFFGAGGLAFFNKSLLLFGNIWSIIDKI